MQDEQRKQKIMTIMRQYQQDKDILQQSYKNISQINYARTLKQIIRVYPDIIHKIPDDLQSLPLTVQLPQSISNIDFLQRSTLKQNSMRDIGQYQQYYEAKQQQHEQFAAKKSSKKQCKIQARPKKEKKKSATEQPQFYKDFGSQDMQIMCGICNGQYGYLIRCEGCSKYYHPQCLKLKKMPRSLWYCHEQCRNSHL